MRSRTLIWRSLIALLVFLIVSGAAGVFLAEGTLHPGRRSLSVRDEAQAQEMARSHDASMTSAAIRARDAITLRAWHIRPTQSNGSAVILLHGQGDNRLGMIGYAEILVNHGFSVLMPDARAHGSSGGKLATYGLLEADDIHRWLDWLEQNQHPDCIFGLGESMGAAQLLQALKGEHRFCAVAAESPFSSFREIAYDRVGQFFHTPWLGRTVLRPVVEVAFGYARWKYGLDFEQVSPEAAVSRTRVPVFLIHGRNDTNIPVRHSLLLAAGNTAVTLWEVPNANHCGAISVARNDFEKRLLLWFDEHSANTMPGPNRFANSALVEMLTSHPRALRGDAISLEAEPVVILIHLTGETGALPARIPFGDKKWPRA